MVAELILVLAGRAIADAAAIAGVSGSIVSGRALKAECRGVRRRVLAGGAALALIKVQA